MTSIVEKFDFDALRKLPPERRVKVLKELHEKLNEFIKQRAQEIEQSQGEIKDAKDFLKEAEEELSVLEEMQSQAPGLKNVKVEELFERGEKKEAVADRRLESIADEAPRQAPSAEDQRAYVNFLSRQPLSNIYERINQIRDDIRHTGTVSMYQQEKLGQFREALHEKEEAIRAGEYAAGKKTEAMLTAAEKAVMYASGQERDKQFYRTHH